MEPSELESRLKSLPLRQPSARFGKAETLAEVLRESKQPQSLVERIKDMPRKLKSAGSLAVAASFVLIYLAIASSSGGTVAFAQALNKLKEAKTLSFDSEVKSMPDGKVLNRSRSYFMIPGNYRSESRGTNDGFAVFDGTARKVLVVDSKHKTARISSFKAAGMDMAAETIERMRELQADESKPVGEKRIDGARAKGFEFDRGTQTSTVWTSVATGELVQIETLDKNGPNGSVSTVWTNIKLDEQLDPKLFSVEPPPGFKVMPFIDIDMNASPTKFVAESLKTYVKHNDNQFPEDLEKGLRTLLEKLAPKDADEPPTEEVAQVSFYSAAAAAVVRSGRQGEVWQYHPGITLGQRDKIVFWLYDKRKSEYSAVFGDLRVEVVSKKQLPPAPAN
jgi:outer membrane lipoprotein-sorting protein